MKDELIAKQQEYIDFLTKAEERYVPFLHTHGFRIPEEDFQKGVRLRQEIEDLKSNNT